MTTPNGPRRANEEALRELEDAIATVEAAIARRVRDASEPLTFDTTNNLRAAFSATVERDRLKRRADDVRRSMRRDPKDDFVAALMQLYGDDASDNPTSNDPTKE